MSAKPAITAATKAIRTRHDRRAAKATPGPGITATSITVASVTPAPASGYAELMWGQIAPDPLNPRKHFDDDDLNELATSILRDGLLENLVVRTARPGDVAHLDVDRPLHRLVAGERRWRAIGKLIARGSWDASAPIMCKVADLDDAGHRRIALVENLQRKDLRPIEEALSLKELMAIEDMGTAEVALEIGFTQRFVQQRLQMLDLPEKLQDQVNTGAISIEQGRVALAILPKLPPIKQVELREGHITVDEAKEWLDDQPEPPKLSPQAWVLALELYDAVLRRPMKQSSWEAERTEVGSGAEGDALLTELTSERLFGRPRKHYDKHSTATGRLYVELGWGTLQKLEAKFGDIGSDKDRLKDLLAEARLAAGIEGEFPPKTYQAPWLNGPFEVPSEIAEAYAAAIAKRAEDEASAKARSDAAEAALEEKKTQAAANAAVVDALLRDLATRTASPCDERFTAALATAGLPAPWRVDGRGYVRAANDADIMHPSWYLDTQPWILVQRVLMVAAVNLAAGVAFTVEPETEAEDADDQVDLEEAIETRAADDDVELTPALMALAGASAEAAE